jgi:tetratricopeptide (TPR) repeat protein
VRQRFVGLIAAGLLTGCSVSAPAPTEKPMPPTTRQRLDDVQRQSSERQYDAAIAEFEKIRAEEPAAITALDALKMVVVYAEVGNLAKHGELTRWLVERHKTPKTSTDAERSVKGYIVHAGAKDKALLEHAVTMTRYASAHAAADGEGEYQGFFDTSTGIAAYRVGRYAEASKLLATTIDHQSLYVRSLALAFYAMSERARGNRKAAESLAERARSTARTLPVPGTDEYGVEWTDILISHRAMEEMEAALNKP